MRHGRIQLVATACGLALSLAAAAGETNRTNEPIPGEAQARLNALAASATFTPHTDSTPQPAKAEKNCWDSNAWGTSQGASARCEKADFLLGSQPADESECYAAGFFDNRPDPLALRPMYSAELLKRFDTDRDGSLSGQERITTEVFLEARRASHKQSLLYKFDFDESYDLSAAEKLEARRVLFLEQTEALNVLVERFDADRDGVLSDKEVMTARLKDAEAFFEVAFHEGAGTPLAYRDGPGLPADVAEAFEAQSGSLTARGKTSQREILEALFPAVADEFSTALADDANDGEQSGGRPDASTARFAEVSAEFPAEVSGEGPPD